MENPSHPDENSDCPDLQKTNLLDSSITEISSQVTQRPGIHQVNKLYPDVEQLNSQHWENDNLYPSLKDSFAKSTPSVKKPAISSEMPNFLTWKNMAILVVALVLGLILAFVPSPEKQVNTREEETGKDTLEHLRDRFHGLRNLFSGQINRLWTVSFAAIRPLLGEPKHPAVILLAGSKQATPTTDCLALKMSAAVKDAFESETPVVVFDCRKYRNWEPQAVKREMDRQLTEAFENGAKVGVVLAVESLPGTSPMIFYRFCDTANAPFKNVVLILTLNMEKEATSDRDSEAHEELGRLWQSALDPEQVDPLFSRIGNSVAYVSKEIDLGHCQQND